MGEGTTFFLRIIAMITIMIPMIDSTANTNNKNAMTFLDGDFVSGSHVDICCTPYEGFLNWERNATGHTIFKSGVEIEMLDWLALSMKIKYECLPRRDNNRFTRDNETNKDVLISLYQLTREFQMQRCHISANPFVITYSRFKDYCDFLSPFVYAPYKLLIPVPHQVSVGGISSIWRPFEISVWTALMICIIITMLLSLVNWLYCRSKIVLESLRNEVSIVDLHWLFLYGLLVSKAGFRAPSSFKMRLAGGAWCIAALILTNCYSSILISLITTSSPEPIVNSVEDLANNDRIELIVPKDYGAHILISGGKDNNPLLKKLDKKLDSSLDSLCLNRSDCFRQVIEEKTTAYLDDEPSLLGLLSADFRRTGKCNAAFAKKPFGLVYLSWGVSKNYSQFENYQRGMLRMLETGLVDHWIDTYFPRPHPCLVDRYSRQAKMAGIRDPSLVDLNRLVPAFLFLLFGLILAFLALLAEWIKKT